MENFKIKVEYGENWKNKGELIHGSDFDLNKLKKVYSNIRPGSAIPDTIPENFIFQMVKSMAADISVGSIHKYPVRKISIDHYVIE
jgi:hypothetical protein